MRVNPLFHVDLKRIETAITGGRLDEAFDRLIESPDRAHRDGQRLIEKLAQAFVQRGEEHLRNLRLDDADHDAEKALRLAGSAPEIAELRNRIRVAQIRKRQDRESQQSIENRIRAGQLTLAAKLLPEGSEGARLAQTIDRDRQTLEDFASKLELAIRESDFESAIRIAESMDSNIIKHASIQPHLRKAVQQLIDRAKKEFVAGRTDSFMRTSNLLDRLGGEFPEIAEVVQTADRCRRARQHLESEQFDALDIELGRLAQLYADAEWVRDAQASMSELLRHMRILRTGPLGLVESTPSVVRSNIDAVAVANTPRRDPNPTSSSSSTSSLVLQIDGLGGILLLSNDRLTIGSASKSERCDLPLRTEGRSSPIEIRRSGEDYFAQSDIEFSVNEQPTNRKLLASNDSIQFGRRGRLRFRKPVPASCSAVLQLSGASLPRRDIRFVALMADSLVFAPVGGHFSLPTHNGSDNGPIVLYRDGVDFMIKHHGSNGNERSKLEVDRSTVVGETRLLLREITLC